MNTPTAADGRGYPAPLDRLLEYGAASWTDWADYVRDFGLGSEHVPDLIRLATDMELYWAEDENPAVWAPIHALRALGQLQAEEAVKPLMRLWDEVDLDLVNEDLMRVYGMIGPAAIPALASYLADDSAGLHSVGLACESLVEIAQRHPGAYKRCIDVLIEQFAKFADNDRAKNGFLLASLLDLRAVGALDLMERAFAAEAVDETIAGDWEDVQIEFGLRKERSAEPRYGLSLADFGIGTLPKKNKPGRAAARKKKAKRKQAKAQRKKQRKKKKKRK